MNLTDGRKAVFHTLATSPSGNPSEFANFDKLSSLVGSVSVLIGVGSLATVVVVVSVVVIVAAVGVVVVVVGGRGVAFADCADGAGVVAGVVEVDDVVDEEEEFLVFGTDGVALPFIRSASATSLNANSVSLNLAGIFRDLLSLVLANDCGETLILGLEDETDFFFELADDFLAFICVQF